LSVTPYEKTVWEDGDYIKAEKMNKIEDGIAAITTAAAQIEATAVSTTEQSLSTTAKQIARNNIDAVDTSIMNSIQDLQERNSIDFFAQFARKTYSQRNVFFTFDSNGACTISTPLGTTTSTVYYTYFQQSQNLPIGMVPGNTYQVNFTNPAPLFLALIIQFYVNGVLRGSTLNSSGTIQVPENATGGYVALRVGTGADFSTPVTINPNIWSAPSNIELQTSIANLQNVVKPELTATQKQEIQQLCQDYLDNAARFEYAYGHTSNDWADYTGAGTQTNPYKTKALVKIDENNQTIWKVNCNTLVQNIWMGRNVSDYVDKTSNAFSASFSDATNTNTYTPYVNQAFDWGYFCDFPLRELLGNLVPNDSSYYGYIQPEGTDVNSYSINSYYSSTSTNAHHQVFKSFLAANDLARRLWEIGCEIPAADMDIGDLVFTKELGQVSDTDLQFFYDQACWRNISHVMIVIDKTAKGLPIFLESADSPSTGYIRTLEPLKWTQTSDSAPANIIQGLNWGARMQSICMVARHPVAYGKNNMHKLWKGSDTNSTMPRIPYIATAAKIIADGNSTMNTMRKENYPFPPYL